MKILIILKKLSKCKLDFKRLKENKLLLFDELTVELFNSRIKKYEILHIRFEKLNFWILIENFFKMKFSFRDYILTFVSKVKPKYMITYNDNDLFFYELKNYFPSTKFIVVQNGYRHKSQDLQRIFYGGINRKLYVDYFFVFGGSSAIFYKKYIKCGKFINLGSFRNNKLRLNNSKKNKGILFIPNFRLHHFKNSKKNYNVESRILKTINFFCTKNKINLYIASSSIKNHMIEKKYYFSELIEPKNVKFIKREKRFSNYLLIDKFDTIVFVDSTLGYEAIGRGKKIVAISCRKNNNKIINPFGYPMIKKNKDFYFTNYDSEKEILRVLNNVYFLSNREWNKKYYNKLKDIMDYNKNNKKLNVVIDRILKQAS